MPPSLTVGCPAFDEEASVERVVRECLEKIPRLTDDFELLFVDDGSTDATAAILRRLSALDPRVRVIRHPWNMGFAGFALTLTRNATKDVYVGISADGEVRIDDLGRMLAALEDGLDVVVGVRTDKPNYSPYRKLVSWTYNSLVAVAFGTDFRDIGATKMWRTQVFRDLDRIVSRSPFMNAELLIRASRKGYRIGFVEVTQLPRLGGKARGASWRWVRTSAVDLVRVAWSLR